MAETEGYDTCSGMTGRYASCILRVGFMPAAVSNGVDRPRKHARITRLASKNKSSSWPVILDKQPGDMGKRADGFKSHQERIHNAGLLARYRS